MIVLPENAAELAIMARDFGAEVLKGHLRYPSETGGRMGDRALPGGEQQAGLNVGTRETLVFSEDLGLRGAAGQQVQDVLNRQPRAAPE